MSARFEGVVKEGARKASALGFPTLNIDARLGEVSGSYAALVIALPATYTAVAYADPDRQLLEAHLLCFTHSLLGQSVAVELLQKIRERESFPDDASLREAIAGDVARGKKYFSTRHV